jgi:carbohydrate-selective porin OprB
MDAEKLTEAVKVRTILYETNAKTYKNSAKKEDAWKDVAEELGCSGKNFHAL